METNPGETKSRELKVDFATAAAPSAAPPSVPPAPRLVCVETNPGSSAAAAATQAAVHAATGNSPELTGRATARYTHGQIVFPAQRCTATEVVPAGGLRPGLRDRSVQCDQRTRDGQFCPRHLQQEMGLRIGPSTLPGAGRGLFAAQPFSNRQEVSPLTGYWLRNKGDRREWQPLSHYVFGVSAQLAIDAAGTNRAPARLINDARGLHKSNCKFVPCSNSESIRVVTTRAVAAGEEFFAPYGPSYWKELPAAPAVVPPAAPLVGIEPNPGESKSRELKVDFATAAAPSAAPPSVPPAPRLVCVETNPGSSHKRSRSDDEESKGHDGSNKRSKGDTTGNNNSNEPQQEEHKQDAGGNPTPPSAVYKVLDCSDMCSVIAGFMPLVGVKYLAQVHRQVRSSLLQPGSQRIHGHPLLQGVRGFHKLARLTRIMETPLNQPDQFPSCRKKLDWWTQHLGRTDLCLLLGADDLSDPDDLLQPAAAPVLWTPTGETHELLWPGPDPHPAWPDILLLLRIRTTELCHNDPALDAHGQLDLLMAMARQARTVFLSTSVADRENIIMWHQFSRTPRGLWLSLLYRSPLAWGRLRQGGLPSVQFGPQQEAVWDQIRAVFSTLDGWGLPVFPSAHQCDTVFRFLLSKFPPAPPLPAAPVVVPPAAPLVGIEPNPGESKSRELKVDFATAAAPSAAPPSVPPAPRLVCVETNPGSSHKRSRSDDEESKGHDGSNKRSKGDTTGNNNSNEPQQEEHKQDGVEPNSGPTGAPSPRQPVQSWSDFDRLVQSLSGSEAPLDSLRVRVRSHEWALAERRPDPSGPESVGDPSPLLHLDIRVSPPSAPAADRDLHLSMSVDRASRERSSDYWRQQVYWSHLTTMMQEVVAVCLHRRVALRSLRLGIGPEPIYSEPSLSQGPDRFHCDPHTVLARLGRTISINQSSDLAVGIRLLCRALSPLSSRLAALDFYTPSSADPDSEEETAMPLFEPGSNRLDVLAELVSSALQQGYTHQLVSQPAILPYLLELRLFGKQFIDVAPPSPSSSSSRRRRRRRPLPPRPARPAPPRTVPPSAETRTPTRRPTSTTTRPQSPPAPRSPALRLRRTEPDSHTAAGSQGQSGAQNDWGGRSTVQRERRLQPSPSLLPPSLPPLASSAWRPTPALPAAGDPATRKSTRRARPDRDRVA